MNAGARDNPITAIAELERVEHELRLAAGGFPDIALTLLEAADLCDATRELLHGLAPAAGWEVPASNRAPSHDRTPAVLSRGQLGLILDCLQLFCMGRHVDVVRAMGIVKTLANEMGFSLPK